MSVKGFFKGTAFKCIAVLLAIVLICGVILTICNSLFYVSPEEELSRAITKIYGEEVTAEEIAVDPEDAKLDAYDAQIVNAYRIAEDGNYLICSRGKGGYGGSIDCWVVVKVVDARITGLKSVSVKTSQGETQLNNLTAVFYQNYIDGYADGVIYSVADGYVVSGTTLSSAAICNAVNGAIAYVHKQLGHEIDTTTPYDGYLFTEYVDKQATRHTVDGSDVTYTVVTKPNAPAGAFTITITVGEGGKISRYVIDKDGSTTDYQQKVFTEYVGKDEEYFKGIIGENGEINTNDNYGGADIETGATRSNYLCLYAGLFATANYEAALSDGGAKNE